MGVRTLRQLLLAGAACAALLAPASADAQGRIRNQNAYDRGYIQGVQHGEFDARAGASFNPGHDAAARRGTDAFRHGYFDGYRAGYDRVYVPTAQRGRRGIRQNPGIIVGAPRGVVDPYARGYERGFDVGLKDGRDGDRYDPVRDRHYRDGDDGFRNEYGSREAYRNNYRAGFRQGYEEGYRQGTRTRRR